MARWEFLLAESLSEIEPIRCVDEPLDDERKAWLHAVIAAQLLIHSLGGDEETFIATIRAKTNFAVLFDLNLPSEEVIRRGQEIAERLRLK